MILVYPIPDPLLGDLLAVELASIGIMNAEGVVDRDGGTLKVWVPDGTSRAAVDAVVAAHDPTAVLAAMAADTAEYEALGPVLQAILAKCRAVAAGTDTFTNIQAQQLLARLTLYVGHKPPG